MQQKERHGKSERRRRLESLNMKLQMKHFTQTSSVCHNVGRVCPSTNVREHQSQPHWVRLWSLQLQAAELSDWPCGAALSSHIREPGPGLSMKHYDERMEIKVFLFLSSRSLCTGMMMPLKKKHCRYFFFLILFQLFGSNIHVSSLKVLHLWKKRNVLYNLANTVHFIHFYIQGKHWGHLYSQIVIWVDKTLFSLCQALSEVTYDALINIFLHLWHYYTEKKTIQIVLLSWNLQ